MTTDEEDPSPPPYAPNYGLRRVTSHPIKGYKPLPDPDGHDDEDGTTPTDATPLHGSSVISVATAFVIAGALIVAGAQLAAHLINWFGGVLSGL